MALRYWINNPSATTPYWSNAQNWSTTSGGTPGATPPGAADDVIFDSNSGTGNAYLTVNTTVKSLTTTGIQGKIFFQDTAGSVFTTLTVIGNATDTIILGGSASNYSATGGITISLAANLVRNISCANFQIPFTLTFAGITTAPATLTFLTNISCQKGLTTNGCGYNLNGYQLTALAVTTNNCSINFGSSGNSVINLTGVNQLIFQTFNTVTLSYSATQKPLINLIGSPTTGTRSLYVAGTTAGPKFSFKFSGSDTVFFSAGYIQDLDASAFTGKFSSFPVYVSGDFTINTAASSVGTTPTAIYFNGTSVQNILCSNTNLYLTYYVGLTGSTTTQVKLLANLYSSSGVNFVSGTLDLNGFTITTTLFNAIYTPVRTLNFNNGTIEMVSTSGTSTFQVGAAGLTYTGTGNLKSTCANTTGIININPNNMSMPVNLILNSIGRTNIIGSNTFLSLSNTQVGSIYFQAGAKTIFLSGFSLYGNPTQQYVVGCTSAALNYLGMPSGNANCDYLQLAWSSAAYGNAPDPLNYNSVWYAGPSSTVLSGSTVVNWFPKSAGQFLAFFP